MTGSDRIELRLDKLNLSLIDIKNISQRLPTAPVISNRREHLSLENIQNLLPYGQVDIDIDIYEKIALDLPIKPIIISSHSNTYPRDLPQVPHAWFKICPSLDSMPEALAFLMHIRQIPQKNLIAYVRGDRFSFTRELAWGMGQAGQFVGIDKDHSVEGQLLITQLPPDISYDHWFAVIGHPIEHSQSPSFHNQWIEQGNYRARYIRLDIHPQELYPSLDLITQLPFKGLSITMPHKMDCATYINDKISAINTLYYHQFWQGANTDALAFERLIPDQEDILILGLGGVSYGIAKVMTKPFTIYNRTTSKYAPFSQLFPKAKILDQQKTFKTIINTLPAHAKIPDGLKCETLLELQYAQKQKTPIQHQHHISGHEFFITQAEAQKEIFKEII